MTKRWTSASARSESLRWLVQATTLRKRTPGCSLLRVRANLNGRPVDKHEARRLIADPTIRASARYLGLRTPFHIFEVPR